MLAAGLAGVPTLLAAGDARFAGGLADPELTVSAVSHADSWQEPLLAVLTDRARRERHSSRARIAATSLCDEAAGESVLARLLGSLGLEDRS
jgi:hypothetical protein